jgi:hypothetical protein
MPAIRFVHLSDIHFGQEQGGTLILHSDVREEVIRDCAQHCAEHGKADGIIVTGDAAYSGQEGQYSDASDWLEQLASAVKCPRTEVCVIPGNHDVDWSRISRAGEIVQGHLRTSLVDNLDAELVKISGDAEDSNPLLPKLGAYRRFAEQYGCDFSSALNPSWVKDYKLGEAHTLRLIGANSVQVSDAHDGIDQMVLGQSQVVWQRQSNVEYLLLVHHPVIWFRDRVHVEPYMQRFKAILVGHEHHLEVRKIVENDQERLEIFAGAVNPPGGDGFPFRYNWLEFSIEQEVDQPKLSITIFPRVWEFSHTRFVPDYNRLGGTESKTHVLTCPNFSPRIHKDNAQFLEAAQDLAPTPEAPPQTDVTMGRQAGEHMGGIDSDSFARLRYFYWRYLSWQERIKLLADLNILPETRDQPLPQTLERLGLEEAQRDGKLAPLWDAIMELLPPDKRESNPFVRNKE